MARPSMVAFLAVALGSMAAASLVACGTGAGAHPAPSAGGGGGATLSPDAPSWARSAGRSGDREADGGHVFICEGQGSSEDEALASAKAICNAKICNLCGVEVETVTQTTETLTGVEMKRQVVESCKRVRKAEDDIQYKQSSCGPGGCFSWLQLTFSAEQEARECKAYAEGNFADPKECERLIDAFRAVGDLTAAAFWERKSLLDQAIVACADIDVRPTPLIQAMDEILWQGVASPTAVRRTIERADKTAPIHVRVTRFLEESEESTRYDLAKTFYRPLSRQGLLETKLLVDRIARVRDFVGNRALVYEVLEALAGFRRDRESDPGDLLAKMEKAPEGSQYETPSVHYQVVISLPGSPHLQDPVRVFMHTHYPAPERDGREMEELVRFYLRDDRVSAAEWADAVAFGKPFHAMEWMLARRDHEGGLDARLTRWVQAARLYRSSYKDPKRAARLLDELDPAALVALHGRVPDDLRDLFDWNRWKHAVEGADDDMLDADVAAALAKMLPEMKAILHRDVAADPPEACKAFDADLELLESHGVDSSDFDGEVCTCLNERRKKDRSLSWDDLYRRALRWGSTCVAAGGRS